MGINLKSLVRVEDISLEYLRGKVVAVDTFNILYQFLSAIRDYRGELFRDKDGRVTSHLMGLFYRTANLLEAGAKPVFVFDGKPVELKASTSAGRREIRESAIKLFEEAKKKDDLAAMRKYAQQASRLDDEMIESAKQLIRALGLPVVQAPHDGEAQASWMCKEGFVDIVASQDWDCLLFGAPVLVRNLTSGAKSEPHKVILKNVLSDLGLGNEQLVEAAILIGTDFNSGVKGIGPKTAIKLANSGKISEYKDQVENFDKIKKLFLEPEVNTNFKLEWGKVNRDKLKEFLLSYGFSEARVKKNLDRIAPKQKGLGDFF